MEVVCLLRNTDLSIKCRHWKRERGGGEKSLVCPPPVLPAALKMPFQAPPPPPSSVATSVPFQAEELKSQFKGLFFFFFFEAI